jgi:hypothetical protein
VPELAFVMSPNQSSFFYELAETLRYELAEQGVPSSIHTEGFPDPSPGCVYALLAPHEFVALEGKRALPDEAVLRRTIYICAEPPGTAQFDRDVKLSRRAGVVFSMNSRAIAEFWRAGIPARHLRAGYSPLRDHFHPEAQRDIDVIFLGALTARRARYLAGCAEVLAPYNCRLQLSDNSRPNHGGATTLAADAKWDLLTRTKVVLNIHGGSERGFEWPRALDAIHAGAVLITEHSAGIGPLMAGEHLFAAAPESLPVLLDAALRDPERLARLRAAAYERIRSWMPMALYVAVLRAAAVELVGRPLPAGASLGRRRTSPSRGPSSWLPPTSGQTDGDSAVLRRELKDISLDLIEVRRQVARLEQLLQSEDEVTIGPEVLYESPAWELRRYPRVTVITALCNQSALIAQALDSISNSHMRELELIVVDDGSSDDSRETTTEWMTAHPWVSAQLIGHRVSRGLGAARNTAVDAARAPYCFVLDAENEVYPRCLDALAWALDSGPETAFSYPMLEVHGTTGPFVKGPARYLQSVFDWRPERLRLGNYIEAMSMIRVDCLRELGGFATDRRLYGWESYDLWCRIAERDLSGQLVPQILARYRMSPSSLASIANLSRTTAMAMVIERAPTLMAGVLPPV